MENIYQHEVGSFVGAPPGAFNIAVNGERLNIAYELGREIPFPNQISFGTHGAVERVVGLLACLERGREIIDSTLQLVEGFYSNGEICLERIPRFDCVFGCVVGDRRRSEKYGDVEKEAFQLAVIAYCVAYHRSRMLEQIRISEGDDERFKEDVLSYIDMIIAEAELYKQYGEGEELWVDAWHLSWQLQSVLEDFSLDIRTAQTLCRIYEARRLLRDFYEVAIGKVFWATGQVERFGDVPYHEIVSRVFGLPGSGKTKTIHLCSTPEERLALDLEFLNMSARDEVHDDVLRVRKHLLALDDQMGMDKDRVSCELDLLRKEYYATRYAAVLSLDREIRHRVREVGRVDKVYGWVEGDPLINIFIEKREGVGYNILRAFDPLGKNWRGVLEMSTRLNPYNAYYVNWPTADEEELRILTNGAQIQLLGNGMLESVIVSVRKVIGSIYGHSVFIDKPPFLCEERIRLSGDDRKQRRTKEREEWGVWRYIALLVADLLPSVSVVEATYLTDDQRLVELSPRKVAVLTQTALAFSRVKTWFFSSSRMYGDYTFIAEQLKRLRTDIEII